MVFATIMGATTSIMRCSDPLERSVEMLRVDRAFAKWMELQEAQANLIANEVCKRFGGH